MKKKIYNLIVLTNPGACPTSARLTISGLNETIQTISNAQKACESGAFPEPYKLLTATVCSIITT